MKKIKPTGNSVYLCFRFVMIFIDTLTIKSGISIHKQI